MSLCIGCMREISEGYICPHCSFDNRRQQSAPLLPYGTVLEKRYIIGREVEINGESTRYISYDRETNERVYIREFLPAGYISREPMKASVTVDAANLQTYEKLLGSFEELFKFLASISEMSAVNDIFSVFRANNTCYVVERCDELISFEEYVAHNNGHIEWEDARPLFMPIISLLETLHKNGFGHYAVAPANIYITPSGKAVLFGFATSAQRKRGSLMRPQLIPGCAAPEQYENNFPLDSITDIYGFTATLFYALTGNLPAKADERLKDATLMMSTNTVKRLPPHVVSALASGLQVKRENRISDFNDLRSQLSVAPAVKAIQEEISRTASMANSIKPKKKQRGMSPLSVGIISTVLSLAVFLFIGLAIVGVFPKEQQNSGDATTTEPSSTAATVAVEDWTGPTLGDYTDNDYESISKFLLSEYGVVCYKIDYTGSDDGYSDTIDEGKILSQNVPKGTPLDPESNLTVGFKVSKGPQSRELPNVKNLSQKDAVAKLSSMGYVVYVNEKSSDSVAEGLTIGYEGFSSGDKLEVNSSVTIIVSTGPENQTEPAPES